MENHPGELNLIFLDMEMGQLDGMETARRLRQIEESLPLVFVTGYTEHVFEGYTVGALGYLLKPVREDQLKEVLSRAAAALLHQRYLVRTQAVQQISGSQVLVGGQTLPISRSCQQAAMIALTRASLEE